MIAMRGYFNGTVCIPLGKEKLHPNQKVIITALDEWMEPKARRLGSLEGKASVSFSEDWKISDEELIGE